MERLEALRRAVRVVQRQEEHDALWEGGEEREKAPAWRPQRCLNTHDALLRSTVESRLKVNDAFSQSDCVTFVISCLCIISAKICRKEVMKKK